MASLTIATPVPNDDKEFLEQIYDGIILDIKNGNCKPMDAMKRYNTCARTLNQPVATDELKKIFKYWRTKFNARRRHEREEFAEYNRTREREAQRRRVIQFNEQTNDDFRSVPPPRSQQNITRNRVVPPVPGYTPTYTGGETKERNIPVCNDVVVIPFAELEFDIPVLIAVR